MRLLYIHMVGAFGGASKSLLEVVSHLPSDEFQTHFIMPAGSAAEKFSSLTSEVELVRGMTKFDNTQYSYYQGIRWLVLLREIFYIPPTLLGLFRARKRWGKIDLIHVNEVTGIIPWLIARYLFNAPVIVHVRSVMRNNDGSLRTSWINYLLRNHADAVIAIDENVRNSLPKNLNVEVIHNSFSPDAIADKSKIFPDAAKTKSNKFKVGFVGNFLRVKGLFDLIEAAKILQESGLDLEYLLVGDDAISRPGIYKKILKKLGLLQDIKEEAVCLINHYKLSDRFQITGFTNNIQAAYQQMDVLCFPSHYDSPGRPIFEAAFYGVPSIIALRNPLSDTVIDGLTGIAVPPTRPEKLADAIKFLACDPKKLKIMGENARLLAEKNFMPNRNIKILVDLYRRCISMRNKER